MGYIKGKDRNQIMLAPITLDDMIEEENAVRVIDKFIDKINLKEMNFTNTILSPKGGQQPFDPADMLKIYLYCYTIRVRSSRRIMAECTRNIELMWLISELKPDFRTIANFRKDNAKSIKKVFKKFVEFCQELNLIKGEDVFTDGTKIKAQNSKSKNYTKATIEKSIEKITKKMDDYLQELEENDEKEKPLEEYSINEIKDKIKELDCKKQELEKYKTQLENSEETQISKTDPECRRMKLSKGGFDTSFNVQTVTDSENDLVVDFEVTNECNDMKQLKNMTDRAKRVLKKNNISNTADKGYSSNAEIFSCLMNGDIPNVFPPKDLEFYEYNFNRTKIPLSIRKQCKIRYKGNTVNLKFYPNKDLLKQRKAKIEHVFGTVKFWDGANYLLTKGKLKATAEIALSFFSYNFKRALNILGAKKLLEALN